MEQLFSPTRGMSAATEPVARFAHEGAGISQTKNLGTIRSTERAQKTRQRANAATVIGARWKRKSTRGVQESSEQMINVSPLPT